MAEEGGEDNEDVKEIGEEGKERIHDNDQNDGRREIGATEKLVDRGDDEENEEENEDVDDTIDLDKEAEDDDHSKDEEEKEELIDDEADNGSSSLTKLEKKVAKKKGPSFMTKMKRKIGFRPKIFSFDSKAVTMQYVPPPNPSNMPSALEAERTRYYRKEKNRYGQEKLQYYLKKMREGTVPVDDLIMKSENNVVYIRGI